MRSHFRPLPGSSISPTICHVVLQHARYSQAFLSATCPAPDQRFRIELGMKVRISRLVKVLRIFGHATQGRVNSHGFFGGETESATPLEDSTSRKIAMK